MTSQICVDADILLKLVLPEPDSQLAAEFDRPMAYDTHYLALAENLECAFWTADQKLFNAVSEKLDWVNFLGNFKA